MSPFTDDKNASALLALQPREAARRLDALQPEERLDALLSLPLGKKRLDLILLSSSPEELTRAMPVEDFVLTVKEIGEVDALELLEMASDEQTTYLADLDLWFDGGIDLAHLAFLNELFSRCSPERMSRWVRALDFEMLVLMFERTLVQVEKDAIDSLVEKLSGRVLTPDGYHFLVVKLGADYDAAKRFVDFVYSDDHERFLAIMGNLGTTPPAEVEELALRWRNARLADRGWPEFEEAQEVYRTRAPEEVLKGVIPPGLDNAPRYPLEVHGEGGVLQACLPHLDDPSRAASQLANLTNRVLIAEGRSPAEPGSLTEAGERVKGYLEIGLSLLGAQDGVSAARVVNTSPLLHVYQVAGHAIGLRARRARELIAGAPGGMIALLDFPLGEILEALGERRPLLVTPSDLARRDFGAPADLAMVDGQLDLIEAVLLLTQALGLDPARLPEPFPPGSQPESIEGLTANTWLVTAFARDYLRLDGLHEPFPVGSLGLLFDSLSEDRLSVPERIGRWAGDRLGNSPPGLHPLLNVLAGLVKEIMRHDVQDLDPRFVGGIWLGPA